MGKKKQILDPDPDCINFNFWKRNPRCHACHTSLGCKKR